MSKLSVWQKNLQWQKKTFFNYKIKIKIKTTTTRLKNELKYSPMSEGNTYTAEPNLDVLRLRIIHYKTSLVYIVKNF